MLRRRPLFNVVLAGLAGLTGAMAAPAGALASPPQAPASLSLDEMYAPPAAQVPGRAGSVVWWRPIDAGDPAGLPAAASSMRVIYRSTSIAGMPNVASATVFTPAGTPPAGGWKVIAWNHVTTGGADACAPSRATRLWPGTDRRNLEFERLTRSGNVLSAWLRRGYVVVRPDYEGIGTPGPHPYLIGRSLARSAVDAVRAARDLVPSTSAEYAVAGHSEGGIAALWTSHYTRQYAPELQLKATLAATPPVDNASLVFDLGVYTGVGQFSALAGLMVNGARLADPALAEAWATSRVLSRLGTSRFAQIETKCLAQLEASGSLGVPFGSLLGPAAPAAKRLLTAELDRNDAGAMTLGPEPVRIYSGSLDLVAWTPMIRGVARKHRAAGANVTYRNYGLGTHANITDDAMGGRDMAEFVARHLD